jgi:hypothetical protein
MVRVTDGATDGGMRVDAIPPSAAPRIGAWPSDSTVGGFALAAAVVDAVCVASVLLFYALEVGRPGQHVFGPVSDATTAVFDVLALPVILWSTRRLAGSGAAWAFCMVALVATAVGAVNSALLVLRLIDEGISFTLSLAVIALQAGWFLLLGTRAGAATGLSRGLRRWALLIGVGMFAGIVVLVPAALLPPTSPLAVVLWIVGGAVGGVAWMSWPAWFALLGRSLRR